MTEELKSQHTQIFMEHLERTMSENIEAELYMKVLPGEEKTEARSTETISKYTMIPIEEVIPQCEEKLKELIELLAKTNDEYEKLI